MTPFYEDGWLTVFGGDCRVVMAGMEPESVHCVVTSPPYWGLRDYGATGQLGLEATPEEYVANMVEVFREVRRVLRADGTVWLNLGDSYAGSGKGGNPEGSPWSGFVGSSARETSAKASKPYLGLAQKQLVGIPWRVAFALQADGWYLRSDIIWSKPNPMPESVTDRPTKSHEYLFLLSKSPRYFFDADAVREVATDGERFHGARLDNSIVQNRTASRNGRADSENTTANRNLRSVWTIATQPYPGAHFATFPRKLVEPCVKAGTSERGVCPECGAPWVRVVDREAAPREVFTKRSAPVDGHVTGYRVEGEMLGGGQKLQAWRDAHPPTTTGWQPTCQHLSNAVPSTVLDPFAGSGTTGAVAQALGRRAILIDLNPDYLAQAMNRNRDIPLGLGAA